MARYFNRGGEEPPQTWEEVGSTTGIDVGNYKHHFLGIDLAVVEALILSRKGEIIDKKNLVEKLHGLTGLSRPEVIRISAAVGIKRFETLVERLGDQARAVDTYLREFVLVECDGDEDLYLVDKNRLRQAAVQDVESPDYVLPSESDATFADGFIPQTLLPYQEPTERIELKQGVYLLEGDLPVEQAIITDLADGEWIDTAVKEAGLAHYREHPSCAADFWENLDVCLLERREAILNEAEHRQVRN